MFNGIERSAFYYGLAVEKPLVREALMKRKHLEAVMAPRRHRWSVLLLTARSGEIAYTVESENSQEAVVAACARAGGDDRAWHVLDVVEVKKL